MVNQVLCHELGCDLAPASDLILLHVATNDGLVFL
jgi:hypothetical protein